MRKYIVSTHLGDEPTWAVSAKKALANVRWRLFKGHASAQYTRGWTVREAEG